MERMGDYWGPIPEPHFTCVPAKHQEEANGHGFHLNLLLFILFNLNSINIKSRKSMNRELTQNLLLFSILDLSY